MFEIAFQYYLLCGVGAFVLHFKLKTAGRVVIEFLPHINERWRDSTLAKFLDAILFTAVGALIGTVLTHPINPQQAIVAGLGWTGLVNSIAKS